MRILKQLTLKAVIDTAESFPNPIFRKDLITWGDCAKFNATSKVETRALGKVSTKVDQVAL
ncbi:MAG: hypothetical protein EBU16_03745 [Actinobacteria bacterium]|nr:hypothetical protein [Actinomycetota bacterium]